MADGRGWVCDNEMKYMCRKEESNRYGTEEWSA